MTRTVQRRKRKVRAWTVWMGFIDGKPHLWRDASLVPCVVAHDLRREVVGRYMDVRKVCITEVR